MKATLHSTGILGCCVSSSFWRTKYV